MRSHCSRHTVYRVAGHRAVAQALVWTATRRQNNMTAMEHTHTSTISPWRCRLCDTATRPLHSEHQRPGFVYKLASLCAAAYSCLSAYSKYSPSGFCSKLSSWPCGGVSPDRISGPRPPREPLLPGCRSLLNALTSHIDLSELIWASLRLQWYAALLG